MSNHTVHNRPLPENMTTFTNPTQQQQQQQQQQCRNSNSCTSPLSRSHTQARSINRTPHRSHHTHPKSADASLSHHHHRSLDYTRVYPSSPPGDVHPPMPSTNEESVQDSGYALHYSNSHKANDTTTAEEAVGEVNSHTVETTTTTMSSKATEPHDDKIRQTKKRHWAHKLVPWKTWSRGKDKATTATTAKIRTNAIVQQTLPGYFFYMSPFILIPILFAFSIVLIAVGVSVVRRAHACYSVDIVYSQMRNYPMSCEEYIPPNEAIRKLNVLVDDDADVDVDEEAPVTTRQSRAASTQREFAGTMDELCQARLTSARLHDRSDRALFCHGTFPLFNFTLPEQQTSQTESSSNNNNNTQQQQDDNDNTDAHTNQTRDTTAAHRSFCQGGRTWIRFTVTKPMKAPIYLYYTLTNMYQNYRAFYGGRCPAQLQGGDVGSHARSRNWISAELACQPFFYPSREAPTAADGAVRYVDADGAVVERSGSSFVYNPCGMAAYAMFNDSFVLYKVVNKAPGARYASAMGRRSWRAHDGAHQRVMDDDHVNHNDSEGESNMTHASALRRADAFRTDNHTAASADAHAHPQQQQPPSASVNASLHTDTLLLLCNGTDFDRRTNDPLNQSETPNRCVKRGISSHADRAVRFRPPHVPHNPLWWMPGFPFATNNSFLNAGWYAGEPGHAVPQVTDEDFQVWMRSAVRANFAKLHRILHVDLAPGDYVMAVDEYFDAASFGGHKGFVLRSDAYLSRGKYWMGVVYLVVGCLCFVVAVSFAVEGALQNHMGSPLQRLPEPKRTWYLIDPDGEEMQAYYELCHTRAAERRRAAMVAKRGKAS